MALTPNRPSHCRPIGSNSIVLICCKFVVQHVVQQIHNNSRANQTSKVSAKQWIIVSCILHVRRMSAVGPLPPGVFNTRPPAITVYMTHVSVAWQNFISPELGKSSRGKYPIFGNTLISIKYSIAQVEGNLYTKKSAQSMQPFWYNTGTGVWQSHKHTTTANTHASIVSHT